MQRIRGSDVFGPVYWTQSTDNGTSWSHPVKVPGLGRRKVDKKLVEGFCDFVPEYHHKTKSVLVLGWNVFYHDGVLTKPDSDRHPVYTVRSSNGQWLEPKILEWNNSDVPTLYTANCAQRITLSDGDILIPLSVGQQPGVPRYVCTVRCVFNGDVLRINDIGNKLELPVGRGLLEPSLAFYKSKYYMTIRAEDGHGYITDSRDGLFWATIKPWSWEDGTRLSMSSTQQRWISNANGLYLVYTRKAHNNINVMRWRAPLYIANVDPHKLYLVRSSEKVVFPISGDGINNPEHVARMGNFHTTTISDNEAWVTMGETLPAEGWKGNTLLARIKWSI
jgi:hypothetical protein